MSRRLALREYGLASSTVLHLAITLLMATPLRAQITPDATLPNPSVVNRRQTQLVITGGTQAGSNLFHSFEGFSVPTGAIASFQQLTPDIETIVARVTGSQSSQIDGGIEALLTDGTVSSADLFLLNPQGIVFGPNAFLNLGGSFLATTGDRLDFADGTQFRADGTQTSPLLTVSQPVGLQIGQAPGPIRQASRSNLVVDEFGFPLSGGLQVLPGRTLALVGGSIRIPGGLMYAPEGHIALGSVTGPTSVDLIATETGWRLGYEGVQDFQSIYLSQSATLDASGIGGGSVQLQGHRITLTDQSFITSTTLGNQPGGDIRIRADWLELDEFSLISTFTLGEGRSGDIAIATRQFTATNGGQVSAGTDAEGRGGNLVIRASDSIELMGQGRFPTIPTGLFTQAEPFATHRGGNLRISTRTLRLQDGAQISTSTFGAADAGRIDIQAGTVELVGSTLRPDGTVLTQNGRTVPTGLFTDTDSNATGNGGQLVLQVDRLRLQEGAVLQTNTEGSGEAGDLTIRASEWVEVNGTAGEGLSPTSLLAASGGVAALQGGGVSDATGRGGTLRIQTHALRVLDGAIVAVGSRNPSLTAEGSGNLQVQAHRIHLDNGGRLIAETASGNGGEIALETEGIVLLRRQSQISTTAGLVGTGGDGGNIHIAADYVISAALENSDITANAFTGTGGNVTITALSLIGIAPSQQPTVLSDITASSQFGLSGVIQINTLDVDPNQGLVALPTDTIDASRLIIQRCVGLENGRFGELVVTGRGGVPTNPTDLVSNETVLTDWATLDSPDFSQTTPYSSSGAIEPDNENDLDPAVIQEAQRWIRNEDGAIALVAEVPHADLQLRHPTCHG